MELNLARDPEASYLLWCAILSPPLLIYLGVFLFRVCCFCRRVDHQAVEEESESDSDDISCSSVSDSSDDEVRLICRMPCHQPVVIRPASHRRCARGCHKRAHPCFVDEVQRRFAVLPLERRRMYEVSCCSHLALNIFSAVVVEATRRRRVCAQRLFVVPLIHSRHRSACVF